MRDGMAKIIMCIAVTLFGLLAGMGIGYMTFVSGGPGFSTENAWRICSSWSGKCAVYPFNEWKREGDTFYHRKDPTRYLRVNSWSYRITEVKVGADGQLVD